MTETKSVLCRAKVNLTLHVGAAIADGRFQGYHPVESLVVFAEMGDWLSWVPSHTMEMTIDGPFSQGLTPDPDNLVFQALNACSAPPHSVCLTKNLPVSAGLGGGSANSAAVLREFDPDERIDATSIGADVPVCRLSETAMMEGIGDRVTPAPGLGHVAAILVNPRVPVSTKAIFNRFDAEPREKEPSQTARTGTLLDRALTGRNDLQPIAIDQTPIIADVISETAHQSGCQLARMSGSGASVFGLFDTDEQAAYAAKALTDRGWWAVATRLGEATS